MTLLTNDSTSRAMKLAKDGRLTTSFVARAAVFGPFTKDSDPLFSNDDKLVIAVCLLATAAVCAIYHVWG